MAKSEAILRTTFRFSRKLIELKGAFAYCCVLVPEKVLKQLPTGRLRLKGFLNQAPIDLAIQYRKTGQRVVMVSKALAR
ncbi:MAG TPA: hypothetical protein DCE81_00490 [Cytophagales bacterium]|nr:hypothetical protein [Cytophagales bacterium]